MESLGVTCFADAYRDRRILLTGHTGFKGSWLALWLRALGARVSGLALPDSPAPCHWDLLRLDVDEVRADVRDAAAVRAAVADARPEIVFHLAAQALVRNSYRDPLTTWSTNVVGTAALLDACRAVPGVRAVVVVTSDKCYEDREWAWGYRESDRLGGHDPYSASKAATELVAASYRDAFFHDAQAPLLATARAGNVIGGGDWGEDRLVPDLVRAVGAGSSLAVRAPMAVRPFQHVLDCLSGYLQLGARLGNGEREFAAAWNFGPHADDTRSVTDVLSCLQKHWPAVRWHDAPDATLRETAFLALDSTLARRHLPWKPVWPIDAALAATAAWYRRFLDDGGVLSGEQLRRYCADARSAGAAWAAR